MNLDTPDPSPLEITWTPSVAPRRSACWECEHLARPREECPLPCPKALQRLKEWGELTEVPPMPERRQKEALRAIQNSVEHKGFKFITYCERCGTEIRTNHKPLKRCPKGCQRKPKKLWHCGICGCEILDARRRTICNKQRCLNEYHRRKQRKREAKLKEARVGK